MAFFLYVEGLRGPSPQIIFGDGDKPLLDEGIRDRVVEGTTRKLTEDEERLIRAGQLRLRDLERRYPPPRPRDEGPAPVAPDPQPPAPTGGAAAKQLEAA